MLQMGIANRDIKLENTLLMDLTERPVLKLCDFGYSKDELCASISKTMCGKNSSFFVDLAMSHCLYNCPIRSCNHILQIGTLC